MYVFVLDKRKKPLTPCRPSRARHLLDSGRAVVHKRFPFTIRLKDRTVEEGVVKPVRVKVDPGARFTGVAVVREDEPGKPRLVAGFEIEHRGTRIRDNITKRANYRRRRRSANTRYRAPRSDNRRRSEGWLPPSLQHRVDSAQPPGAIAEWTTISWMARLARIVPVSGFSIESVKAPALKPAGISERHDSLLPAVAFVGRLHIDTQKMLNPEISGKEYQQGELAG